MDITPQRPHHPSYLLHRRQTAWQVILPIVLAGLILIGTVLLLCFATFRGNGDVDRWAAISIIWLVLPVMLGGLVTLAALVGVTYLLGRGAGLPGPAGHQRTYCHGRPLAGLACLGPSRLP